MPRTQTLEYNKETGKITLNEYDEGFLDNEVDVTTAILTLALEKLYDDYDLDEGDELLITKKKSLDTHTKIKLEKK